jgi:hypothetical protein
MGQCSGTGFRNRASLRSPLLITWSISSRGQFGVSASSQPTSSRTFCTRTQPEEWKRKSSPNRFFDGVSCMYTPSLLGKLMRIEPSELSSPGSCLKRHRLLKQLICPGHSLFWIEMRSDSPR